MFLAPIQNHEAKQDFFRKLEAWECSTKPCTSETCPITTPHSEGRYLHDGHRSSRNPTFGSCNPPPEVWAAYHRIKAGEITDRDRQLVEGFKEHHVFQSHGSFSGSLGPRRRFGEKKALPWGSACVAELS